MEINIMTRLKHSWNAFMNRDPTYDYRNTGPGYSSRPDRPRFTRGNERSIVTAIYNRIALDAASVDINHCRIDNDGRFIEKINSSLNSCLNLEANIDQTGRAFIQDVVMSMLDEGCVAIVPVDTDINPSQTESYKILSMRTGKILEWYPRHVKVRVYNERTGEREEIKLEKKMVAIVENPLYAVINEHNSTMKRLTRKLALLDNMDERISSGKLDMIIQLPYSIKSEARRTLANERRADLEKQLSDSTYGIGYVDGTEKIVQLNRPLDNNLMKQVEYLTAQLYSQLGITQAILDGSASEEEMLNYYSRTIEPIVSAIVDEMKRKFLTKTARSQNQTIEFFRDSFRLVPLNKIAEIAGVFTQNEILTANEVRQIIGMKPSNDPKADQLVNSNINQTGPGSNKSSEVTKEDEMDYEPSSVDGTSISDL